MLLLAIQKDPDRYAHMDRLDEVGKIVRRLRAVRPFVVPTYDQIHNPAHRELSVLGDA